MSATTVTLLDARWFLHVAEDREASHQVRCRSGCTAGASTCDTGRALTAEVVEAMSVVETCAQTDAMTCHTCADRGTVQGRPCIDCSTDA